MGTVSGAEGPTRTRRFAFLTACKTSSDSIASAEISQGAHGTT